MWLKLRDGTTGLTRHDLVNASVKWCNIISKYNKYLYNVQILVGQGDHVYRDLHTSRDLQGAPGVLLDTGEGEEVRGESDCENLVL